MSPTGGARDLPRPQRGLMATLGRPGPWELRAGVEVGRLLSSPLWRRGAPAADGRAAVLVAGFLGGTASLDLLSRWMVRGGWDVEVARIGANAGPGHAMGTGVDRAVSVAADRSGAPVTLVGHSRGGQVARVVAARRPGDVETLVTLGAPLRQPIPQNLAVRVPVEVLRLVHRLGWSGTVDDDAERRFEADLTGPLPPGIDYVSIYSRRDGVVDWRACLDADARCIEVSCTHLAMAADARVYRVLDDVLAR